MIDGRLYCSPLFFLTTAAHAYRDRGCRSLRERNSGGEYRAGFFPKVAEYGDNDGERLDGIYTGLFVRVQVSMYIYGDGWPGEGIMGLKSSPLIVNLLFVVHFVYFS